MTKRNFTLKEWFYWTVRAVFGSLTYLPTKVANWATDRLNKSYFPPNK